MMKANDYMAFMFNEENEFNCENCPDNRGFSTWGGNFPCGQQNCWVTCHNQYSEWDEEYDEGDADYDE